jgi:ankyrin repeat protein
MDAGNFLIFEASHNPHFVDERTQDTVLHALSIVRRPSHEIIRYLREFVVKGVNLNQHNRDGHHPLAAFIRNQSLRGSETGATMAKYIDILLQKDGKHSDCREINVNMMSRDGRTALYEAAVRAQSDTVRSLIEAGANVNTRMSKIIIIYSLYFPQ